jgi:hypothetical protein
MGVLARAGRFALLLNRALQLAPAFPMLRSLVVLAVFLAACLTPEIVGAVRSVQLAYAQVCSFLLTLTFVVVRCSLWANPPSRSFLPFLTVLSPRASPVF